VKVSSHERAEKSGRFYAMTCRARPALWFAWPGPVGLHHVL